MRRGLLVAALLASTSLVAAPALANGYHFQRVATIPLPTKPGHGDIVTYDPMNGMVYVSLVDDGLAVVDTRTNKVVHDIKNIPSPNGNTADANYVYVAAADGPGAGKVNAIVVISKKTWKEVGRVTTKGTSPDWIQVESNRIYVDSDDANQMEVYSTGEKPKLEHVWPLFPPNAKAGPDVATVVPSMHTIFQSDDSFVLAVNTSTGKIDRHMDTGVKLLKHGGTKGEVYDARHNRLWVATTNETPGVFVLNPETLKVIKTIPEKGGVDQAAFDPKLGLLYTFEGGAHGFDAYNTNTMAHVAFVEAGGPAGPTHTGDVDTKTHMVYAYDGSGPSLDVFKPVK
jgi:hypothetical protein